MFSVKCIRTLSVLFYYGIFIIDATCKHFNDAPGEGATYNYFLDQFIFYKLTILYVKISEVMLTDLKLWNGLSGLHTNLQYLSQMQIRGSTNKNQ